MSEIVVDANVFAHALNPSNPYFDSALKIVTDFLETESILALDDTGKKSPNEATSNLFREYAECISPNSISFSVIRLLLDTGRVVFHPRPARELWKRCQKLTPRNQNDAIVLGIGVRTDEHLVISNDFQDFHVQMRHDAAKHIGVRVVDSDEFGATA